MPPAWLIWVAVAYICGSISFALLLGRLHGVDIRKAGSGNVGATNVGRLLGRKWGLLCFMLDLAKGLGPVLAAGLVLGYVGNRDLSAPDAWKWLAVAAAAIVGHVFPLWHGLRGGKGVATSFGALLGIWPALTLPALVALVTWLLLAGMFRYVGLASVLAAVALPGYLWVIARLNHQPLPPLAPFFIVTALLAALVILRHRSNLARTFTGAEPRLGEPRP